MRTPLLLLLVSCTTPETGIDHTVLTGTITIPAATASDSRTNDSIAAPTPLGVDDSDLLTWRSVIVDGKVSDWPAGFNAPGDPDNYAFTPVADGTFTFTLSFATTAAGAGGPPPDTGATDTGGGDTGGGDTGGGDTADTGDTGAAPTYADADVLRVRILDPATFDEAAGTGILAEVDSDGTVGNVTFDYDVIAGTTYVVEVFGVASQAEAVLDYTLVVSGSAPTDATILVGAYLGSDPTVAENPVGGTNAVDWTYDPVTYAWNGSWKMTWLRAVTTPEDENPDDLFPAVSTVAESPATFYVRAGSLTSLNAGLAAGALYSTAVVELSASGGEQELVDPLVLDGLAPKIIGIQTAETLPDTTDAQINAADNTLDLTTMVAQDLGVLSVPGFVDVITGSSLIDPGYEGWNATNDSDAYSFTLAEPANVRMAVAWAGTADIDIGIWYEDATYGVIDLFSSFSDDYCLTGDNPEVCESSFALEAGVAYHVVVLGYSGDGDVPYTLELEWSAP